MNKCKILLIAASMSAAIFVNSMALADDADVPVADASQSYSVGDDNSIPQNDTPQVAPVSTAQQTGNTPASSSTQDPAVLLTKIQSMQQEIQQLRGQIEVQSHDLKMLQQQQKAFYSDLDQRIAQLSHTSAHTSTSTTQKIAAKKLSATNTPTTSPVVIKTTTADTLTATATTATDDQSGGDAKKSYAAAYRLITEKKFAQATPAMQNFLKTYGASSYAASAHYWLGELYLAQNQTDQAITEFSTVVNKYQHSAKIAAATLKLGFAYYDKGQLDQAKTTFTQVVKQFPETTSARLAQNRLRDINQATATIQ